MYINEFVSSIITVKRKRSNKKKKKKRLLRCVPEDLIPDVYTCGLKYQNKH